MEYFNDEGEINAVDESKKNIENDKRFGEAEAGNAKKEIFRRNAEYADRNGRGSYRQGNRIFETLSFDEIVDTPRFILLKKEIENENKSLMKLLIKNI